MTPTSSNPPAFTAAQIARALGRTRQAVFRQLNGVPCDETKTVSGNAAHAWRLCSLPAVLQAELETNASRQGCRNAEHLLNTAGPSWHLLTPPRAADGSPPKPKSESLKRQFLHSQLDEVIAHLENKTAPTADDRAWLFDSAFHHHEKLCAAHTDKRERKAIKSSLVDYLFNAVPALSKTPTAMRRVFEMKLKEWRDNGRMASALQDNRHLKSGNFRTPDFTADKEKITQQAILHGGNESLAFRKLWQKGELSQ